MFSVSFQFPVGFCFLKPRDCWLLFSSSFVDLGICFNYCLDLMLERLGVALPSLEPPLPPLLLPTHRALGTHAHPLGSVSRHSHRGQPLWNACPPREAVQWDPPSTDPPSYPPPNPPHALCERIGGPSVWGGPLN